MASHVFVLVHGAWHGGWCWKKLVALLRADGHEVYAPTLTGLGERAHLLAPGINLTTHINDILGVLHYEDLSSVVLVGHSSGGMVISGVVERIPERVAHAIYLDAFLPNDGESIRDIGENPRLDEIAETYGDGWRMPPLAKAAGFGVTNPEDIDWVDSRLGDTSYATFTQPIELTRNDDDGIARSFVLTSRVIFPNHASRARKRGYAVRELVEAGHNAMVTMPHELAALLLDLVSTQDAAA